MSDAQTIACATCDVALDVEHFMFGAQVHHISYVLSGDTPSDQAYMQPSEVTTFVRYCSSECCYQQLASRLEDQGLPGHLQHHRVYGGPIEPCGKCGKPVNLCEPHVAWIKGDVRADIQNGEDAAPHCLDVMTVVCAGCARNAGFVMEVERVPEKRTFEQLLQELKEFDEMHSELL